MCFMFPQWIKCSALDNTVLIFPTAVHASLPPSKRQKRVGFKRTSQTNFLPLKWSFIFQNKDTLSPTGNWVTCASVPSEHNPTWLPFNGDSTVSFFEVSYVIGSVWWTERRRGVLINIICGYGNSEMPRWECFSSKAGVKG